MASDKPLDPHKTLYVIYHKGRKVGSIPVTAPNAQQYLNEMARYYKEGEVRYEPDPTGGLLAMLHGSR